MASSMEVTLTMGWDAGLDRTLHEYLVAPLPIEVAATQNGQEASGQHLTLVSGTEIADDLPGSAQAGTVRIYAACLRRGSHHGLVEYLKKAPWMGHTGILICFVEDFTPFIHTVGWSKEDESYGGELIR